ncbi:hypothetical protein GIV52_18270 [Pseudomonas syringae]|uniref:Uncharacterized protein n=1 Tax=Pseudomonas syringae TaxID=317 RepID=A0A9Q4A4D6_PSESX|nr:hypothetical protein [Pseudomonas syringae]MCF5471767.1 hypothetical protein [Pseudomonas syringae]MCF5482744.1 hypothetical protein [Pseudomonas syringae]MCF5488980.1 hypothetical protein [Pseudomonas syringae]MCF5493433.1 hypothetical protein [Pseudomonas syringae]
MRHKSAPRRLFRIGCRAR